MTVQFIFGHGVVGNECAAFISCEGPIFFLSSTGVTPSGNPAVKAKRALYEWRHMLCWLLHLTKASTFQSFPCCQPPCSSILSLPPFPSRLSHLSAQITLSSLLCQKWHNISYPTSLNHSDISSTAGVFSSSESCLSLHRTVSALCISYTSSACSRSLWMSQIVPSASSAPPATAAKPISLAGSNITSFYLFHQN